MGHTRNRTQTTWSQTMDSTIKLCRPIGYYICLLFVMQFIFDLNHDGIGINLGLGLSL